MSAKFKIETTFPNEFVRCDYGVSISYEVDTQMLEAGADLTDVNQVLKTGSVVWSGMAEEGGGLWVVRGRSADSVPFKITVRVVSSEYRVEVKFVKPLGGPK